MIGQTVSHYRILSKLGQGGMGVVYKAEDLTLQRSVALKFLPPESVATDADRSRLVHEARAAAALLHPHICPVYEIGESEGQTFIAMGYLEGRSLRDRLSDGPLPVDEALKMGREIGEALSAAHEKGIVHRDVKPGNVMVTPEGRAVLMDFGLARMTGSTKLTRTGTTMGTAAYMSPEQIQGKDVDARTDIWALGVMLYEMVSGELPFQADYAPALAYVIANEDPKPLAGAQIPAGLPGLIAKALAKDPGQRYQTAAALVADVRALETDREALPAGRLKPATGWRRVWKRWRPWQRVAAVSAVCVVAGVIVLMQVRSARDASNLKNAVIAVIEFRNSVNPGDPTVSSGITQLVQVGLTEASPIRVISPELLYDIRRRLFGSQRGSIEPDQVLEVAKTAGSTFFVTGEMMGSAGEEYVTWRLVETKSGKSLGGRRVTGRTMMELADGIIRAVVPLLPGPAQGKVPESLASTSEIVTPSREAYEHYVKADLAVDESVTGGRNEAIVELREAIAIDSTFALAYLQLAAQLFGLADTQELKNLTGKAWAYRDRLGLRDRMLLEGYREELNGDVPAAMTTYREIHARWPDHKKAMEWLAGTAGWYWYVEEALTVSTQGLAFYPEDEFFVSINLTALRWLGRGEEALQKWIVYATKHPTPWVWSEVGENYWTQGFPDSAEACLRRSSSVWPEQPGEWERKIADCFYARGDVTHAIEMREALLKQPDVNNEHKATLLGGWASGLIYHMADIGRFNRSFELLHEYESAISGSAIIENNAEVPRREIYLLTQMGRAAKAVDLARTRMRSMATVRDSLLINLELIEALAAAGSVNEARWLLNEVLELDENVLWGPNRYRALLMRSVVSLAEGDPEGALKVIHETEKVAVPAMFIQFGAAYRETLARAYWQSGRLKDAVSTYQALLRVFGGHAVSHYELGQVYEQMKRPADAKKEYARFLEMWSEADDGLPQLIDARSRIARL